jgi:glyoxylase-like metal-dependent hydrolase (beta-lactamase superfamily II)/rhodanese-related sulfurtransferase
MIFEQHYLSCLSHASYLIGDEASGRAVVVDPQRDVAAYVEDAERHHLRIECVLETHVHADFVSGHLELAARTGASIGYGEAARTEFPIDRLRDGERLSLGEVTLEIRATPGHTPESISIVVYEQPESTVPFAVLTGDTLFIGDVGRPDLNACEGLQPESMARQLYQSLHARLLTLPDETRVYPAHGAGSACGKNLSSETSSTIGEQRRDNYALQPMAEDDFVALVTEGQPARPAYFSFDAQQNRGQHSLLSDEPPPRLRLDEVLELQRAGAAVLDTRSPADFAAGHLRGALNVGLQGRFAEYAGDVVRPEQAIVLVCDAGTEQEARMRLGRIGFDAVAGHLHEPMRAFIDNPSLVEVSSRLTGAQLVARLGEVPGLVVLDVRNAGELGHGAIPGSVHIPLAALLDRLDVLDPARPTVVHCAGGYRSSIAGSLLAARGFRDVSDLLGGYDAWAACAT